MLIVFTTVSSNEDAELIAKKIVDERLAACVQILPKMTSVYCWEGKLQKESEHLLIIKTADEKYSELEKFIAAIHSYDVPEIVAIRAENVSADYLEWLNDSLSDLS
ncbi:MAG: divalent-cation tolerance protein CutA [Pyrinomonadaceae bacterium]